MKGELLDSYESSAFGAKLSRIDFLADYPSSLVVNKKIGEFISNGFPCDILKAESQSAALSAAIASECCEKRAFLSLKEIDSVREFSTASHMRLPIVAVSTNALAVRDLGWIIFLPESNQEILDTVIQAYRICEDNKVLLPALINIDFPIREPVLIPTDKSVNKFLPKLKLKNRLDLHKPLSLNTDDDFRDQQQKAMLNAIKIMEDINEKWESKFKRDYSSVEKYFLENSDYAIVIYGSDSSTAKAAVNKLREQGESIGLLRIRVLRPFPSDDIQNALKGVKKIAVIDKEVSLGSSGILYPEIRGISSNFIAMRRISEKNIFDIYNRLKESEKEERIWI